MDPPQQDGEFHKLTPEQADAVREYMKRVFPPSGQNFQWLQAEKGVGKTHVASEIAKKLYEEYGIRPLIICLPGLFEHWKRFMDGLGIPVWDMISWHSLAGRISKKGGVPVGKINHKYLVREAEAMGPFHVTEEFINICRQGCFLIFDESQKIKNTTAAMHWAAHALVASAIAEVPDKCCGLQVSAGILSKDTSYECLYRMLNLCGHHTDMYKYDQRFGYRWVDYGLGTAYNYACLMDANKTNEIFSRKLGCSMEFRDLNLRYRIQDKKQIPDILKWLWEELMINHWAISVDSIVFQHEVVRRNAFYILPAEEAEICIAAILGLKRANIIDKDGVNAQAARGNMALIQSAMMKLAHSKIGILIRKTKELLRANPTAKVMLGIPFKADQEYVAEELKIYSPLILNGDVPHNETITFVGPTGDKVTGNHRDEIVAKFNTPSVKHRLLICTPEVGGVGLSMHDHVEPNEEQMKALPMFKTPEEALFPRFLLAISGYNFDAMDQLFGRITRHGMRSPATVIAVYAKNAPLESVLVNTMIKSGVAKGSLLDKTRIFPNEYNIWIENETEDDAPLREMLEKMRAMSAEQLKLAKKTV
uniref:Helicase ATP-binding domain-containing protein n=1 Tax=viral metagenome TaxID=1070528 RepID=A0A6C0CGU2_9ZZZZ